MKKLSKLITQDDSTQFSSNHKISFSDFSDENQRLDNQSIKTYIFDLFFDRVNKPINIRIEFPDIQTPDELLSMKIDEFLTITTDPDYTCDFIKFYSKVFNSTISKLPPKTVDERLLDFVNSSDEIINLLRIESFEDSLWKMDKLNDSISRLILSKELPAETNQALDNLSDSLKICYNLIYKKLVEHGNVAETIRSKHIIEFLQDTKNVLNAYAHIDEWEAQMAREWGGQ